MWHYIAFNYIKEWFFYILFFHVNGVMWRVKIDYNHSSSVLELWLYNLFSLVFGFLLNYFLVHGCDDFIWFSIRRHSPIFLCAFISISYFSLLYWFALILFFLFFVVFLYTDIAMNPINLILFTLICIWTLFMAFSFGSQPLLISANISFQSTIFIF